MRLFSKCDRNEIEQHLQRIGMQLKLVADAQKIPGSFWGEPEAGLINDHLYVRSDTPFHSVLHESCHYICMTSQRRKHLHTNAIGKTKGDYSEEDAVCYLQLLIADGFSFYSQNELMQDMDTWGYNFRLGSAKEWFERDALDAYHWLLSYQLINQQKQFLYQLRK